MNTKLAIEKMLDGKNTNSYTDRIVHAAILKLTKNDPELYSFTVNLIMEKRKNWLLWYTKNQNSWQLKSKNRNHDSFEIREKYIAPHVDYPDDTDYEKKQRAYNRIRNPKLYIERDAQLARWAAKK